MAAGRLAVLVGTHSRSSGVAKHPAISNAFRSPQLRSAVLTARLSRLRSVVVCSLTEDFGAALYAVTGTNHLLRTTSPSPAREGAPELAM